MAPNGTMSAGWMLAERITKPMLAEYVVRAISAFMRTILHDLKAFSNQESDVASRACGLAGYYLSTVRF